MICDLINGGMASLIELQTVYSVQDAFLLDEALRLRNYHSWLASKHGN